MKRVILCLLLIIGLYSCGSSIVVIPTEVRSDTESGLNFSGKSISVCYFGKLQIPDSLVYKEVARGLVSELDRNYFDGKREIKLVSLPSKNTLNIQNSKALRDSLLPLITLANSDIVFFVEQPKITNINIGDLNNGKIVRGDSVFVSNLSLNLTQYVYVYDTMDKRDKVVTYKRSDDLVSGAILPLNAKNSNDLYSYIFKAMRKDAFAFGRSLALPFMSKWIKTDWSIFNNIFDQEWIKAADYAYSYNWDKALDIWLDLLNKNYKNSPELEYNVAFALYVLRDYPMSRSWLKLSDTHGGTVLNKDLDMLLKK